MTFEELRQLRTYAQYDGVYLAVIWIASFVCLASMHLYMPLYLLWLLLAVSTPFFVAYRLRIFRNEGRDGIISFWRAFHYCLRVFVNASLLFAIAQWVYLRFIGHDHLVNTLRTVFSADEAQEVLKVYGQSADDLIKMMSAITPLEFATSYFLQNLIIGAVLSVVIAATGYRQKTVSQMG